MLTPPFEAVRFQSASDQSMLVYLGQQTITPDALQPVMRLLHLLSSEPIAGVRNLQPAYCSVLIKFDPLTIAQRELEEILSGYVRRLKDVILPEPKQVEIPVCYGGEFGSDLSAVASLRGMMPSDAIEIHASAEYLVHFLGFVPGFAYLGGLPQELATPRRSSPRRRVPAGSVGIAGDQTGVYPFATPGGWQLIGRTPVAMFRQDRADMSLLALGDHVRFRPISREEFAALENN
jgi:inhibitor of KinA